MSGHSKWSQIKRKKGIKDQERGKLFSKLSRMITLSVIDGGGIANPVKNAKLRLMIEKAKSFNMPKDNIVRAIEKANHPEEQNLKEVIYEGFGPNGIVFMILASTNNPNRICSNIRSELEKYGGKLGGSNSVAYLFEKCGVAVFEKDKINEVQILDLASKFEALDLKETKNIFIIYFPFDNLGRIGDFLQGVSFFDADVNYKPLIPISLKDKEIVQKIAILMEVLENLDDVYKVFTNLDSFDDLITNHEKN